MKLHALIFFVFSLALAVGCSSGTTISIPQIAPIVKASLPSGLTGASHAARVQRDINHVACGNGSAAAINACAAEYISAIFNNYYIGSDGSGVQGFILTQETVVDQRMTLFNGQTASSHSCLGNAFAPYTLDLSALNASDTTTNNMLKFTLSGVQCTSNFQGSTGGISGEVFGVNGTSVSVWVTLGDMAGDDLNTGGAFMNLANVTNVGSTDSSNPETVDGLSLNYTPANANNSTLPASMWVARFKAIENTTKFELYFAGTTQQGITGFASSGGTGGNGNPAYVTGGFRMISDGTNIYSDGTLCTDDAGTNCNVDANYSAFSVCLDGSTIGPIASNTCLALSNSFTLSPNVTPFTDLTTFNNGTTSTTTNSPDPLTLFSLTSGGSWADEGKLSPVGAIKGSVLTAMNSVYKVSNASSSTGTY